MQYMQEFPNNVGEYSWYIQRFKLLSSLLLFLLQHLHHVNRSEEHTSELQSQSNLVCRLLLEKKKKNKKIPHKSKLTMILSEPHNNREVATTTNTSSTHTEPCSITTLLSEVLYMLITKYRSCC